MKKAYEIHYKHGDDDYLFSLQWNEEEFIDGNLNFKIAVRRWTNKNGHHEELENHELTVAVEEGENGLPVLVIYMNGEKAFSIPLDEIFSVDGILEAIPAWIYGGGDPITGCLIRSGLSVTIKQILSCKKAIPERIEGFWAKARMIGKCLVQNFPGMCGRLGFRTAKCILRAGF